MSGASIADGGRLGLMLTELRLPTIKRLASDLCAQSDREGWPGHRLLESLLEHEIAEREARRTERHRAESSLSPDKRLSSFDFNAVPCVSKAQVMALAEGTEWLDRGANVLLFGPPGVGKSHLVCALGHALIDAGRRVLFTRCSELVQRLQAARRDLRLPQELAPAGPLRPADPGRSQLRPPRPGRDLRAVRTDRRAIRAQEPGGHGQHAVLEVGRSIRRCRHDGGRGGQAGAPRHDPGDERAELPTTNCASRRAHSPRAPAANH
jgi:IstB-like ATP binding protein